MARLFSVLSSASGNSKIIIKNTIGAFVVRGLGLLLSVFSAPAYIHYFDNKEVMGIWFTLLSVLIWFLNFDLGVGNGIRNQLVCDISNKDYESAKKTISSGLVTITLLGVVLTIIGSILIAFSDLNSFFNVSSDVLSHRTITIVTIVIFFAIMLRFVLTTVSSLFYAIQKSAINNLLSLIVAFLQFVFIIIFHFDNIEKALLYLSVSYLLISNIPVIVAGIIVFSRELKECRPGISYIDKSCSRRILGVGSMFFFCQILYMLIANTNEFLITNLYGGQCTTEYTFYHKLTNIAALIITLAMGPVWSVVTKAQAEKDYVWLLKLYSKIKIAGLVVLVIQFLLVPFVPYILDLWLGRGVVNTNTVTTISFGLFASFQVYSSLLSTITNGLFRMKLQAICFSIGVIGKFAIVFSLHSFFDWSLIVWSTVFAFVPYVLFQHVDLNIFLKKQVSNSK